MIHSIVSFIVSICRQGFPCLFHLITGYYCPGCGGTRAFKYMLRGQLEMSLRYHPIVLYGTVVIAAEGVTWILSKVFKKPEWYLAGYQWFAGAAVLILAVNWIYKNYMLIVRGIDLLP